MPNSHFFEEDTVDTPSILQSLGMVPHGVGTISIPAPLPEEPVPAAFIMNPAASSATASKQRHEQDADEPHEQIMSGPAPGSMDEQLPIIDGQLLASDLEQPIAVEPPLAAEADDASHDQASHDQAVALLAAQQGAAEADAATAGATVADAAADAALPTGHSMSGTGGSLTQPNPTGEEGELIDRHSAPPNLLFANKPESELELDGDVLKQQIEVDEKEEKTRQAFAKLKANTYQSADYARWRQSEKKRLKTEARRMQMLAEANKYKAAVTHKSRKHEEKVAKLERARGIMRDGMLAENAARLRARAEAAEEAAEKEKLRLEAEEKEAEALQEEAKRAEALQEEEYEDRKPKKAKAKQVEAEKGKGDNDDNGNNDNDDSGNNDNDDSGNNDNDDNKDENKDADKSDAKGKKDTKTGNDNDNDNQDNASNESDAEEGNSTENTVNASADGNETEAEANGTEHADGNEVEAEVDEVVDEMKQDGIIEAKVLDQDETDAQSTKVRADAAKATKVTEDDASSESTRYAPVRSPCPSAQSASSDLGPVHGGHCTPICTWKCESQKCDQVCEPVCKAPKCETRCNDVSTEGCSMDCSKPHCTVMCSKEQCVHEGCPRCTTKCNEPECKLKCPTKQRCENVCEHPDCDWKCKAPKNCPKPKCKMICETHHSCHSTSFVQSMPRLAVGHKAVSNFRAPFALTGTREGQENVDVEVQSLAADMDTAPMQRMVSMPVLEESALAPESTPSWVPTQAGNTVSLSDIL